MGGRDHREERLKEDDRRNRPDNRKERSKRGEVKDEGGEKGSYSSDVEYDRIKRSEDGDKKRRGDSQFRGERGREENSRVSPEKSERERGRERDSRVLDEGDDVERGRERHSRVSPEERGKEKNSRVLADRRERERGRERHSRISPDERDREKGRGRERNGSISPGERGRRNHRGDVDNKESNEDREISRRHGHQENYEDGRQREKRDDKEKYSRERRPNEGRLTLGDPDDYDRDRRSDYRHRGHTSQTHEDDSRHSRDNKATKDSKAQTKAKDLISQKPQGLQDGKADGNSEANLGRSGGVYIPPFKLAQMMKDVEDKSSVEYQRLTWDALRKSINGLVNKVNATNIKNIIPELFAENLIRGRGLFCRSCMKSQMASPGFTDVFAALVAVVNTKFPEVGNLLLRRIILQLKRAYKRNDKPQLLAATKFIAHLVNQQVAHEIIALELLTVLLENPTDDSVEVAVGFVKECGSLLQDLSPQGLHGIFERFRGILHEGEIDKRVQFLIEGLFAIRKAKFQGYPAVRPELDLVEQEDQFTHELSLEDEIDQEIGLDIFKLDQQFLENEKAYEDLKRDIIGEESSEDEAGSDESSDDEDDDESADEEEEAMQIKDETETNLVNLRRTIYLTIMSSVDFEEAGHKLLKIKLEPGQEMELCIMLLECCSQERTYLRYYGLLGQRFCMINKVHQENFEKCFVQQYSMIHRLETNKLRNVAKFFAHLLGTDALPWHVLAYIRLTEEDTTSSSRIFIKILFQELSEHLGIRLLNERLNDSTMLESFESIFPRDNPKNTRFSINFFTSIGLGGITENLREYLKNMPRLIMQQQKPVSESDESGSSSSSSDDSGSASKSETESESSSEESEREERHKKRRKRH